MGGGSSKDANLSRFTVPPVLISGISKAIGERSVTAGGSKKLILLTGFIKPQEAQKITVFGRMEGVIASCIVGERTGGEKIKVASIGGERECQSLEVSPSID